jgi:hypothetical protein
MAEHDTAPEYEHPRWRAPRLELDVERARNQIGALETALYAAAEYEARTRSVSAPGGRPSAP